MSTTWKTPAYEIKHMPTEFSSGSLTAVFCGQEWSKVVGAGSSVWERTAISGYAGQQKNREVKKSFCNCGVSSCGEPIKAYNSSPCAEIVVLRLVRQNIGRFGYGVLTNYVRLAELVSSIRVPGQDENETLHTELVSHQSC